MTILIQKTETSAFVLTDDLASARAKIATQAKILRVSLSALGVDRRIDAFATADMSDAEQATISEQFGFVPATIYQIELIRGPGGVWIADAMLKSGDAKERANN